MAMKQFQELVIYSHQEMISQDSQEKNTISICIHKLTNGQIQQDNLEEVLLTILPVLLHAPFKHFHLSPQPITEIFQY